MHSFKLKTALSSHQQQLQLKSLYLINILNLLNNPGFIFYFTFASIIALVNFSTTFVDLSD